MKRITRSKVYRNKFYNCAKKFGVVLRFLKPQHRDLLRNNDFIKFIADDDRTLYALFKLYDMELDNKWKKKIYYDELENEFGIVDSIEVLSKTIDWKCAICNEPIKVKMGNRIAKFFLCDTCLPDHWKPRTKIDRKIVDSSIRFNKYCKKILKKKQRSFLRHIEINSKTS